MSGHPVKSTRVLLGPSTRHPPSPSSPARAEAALEAGTERGPRRPTTDLTILSVNHREPDPAQRRVSRQRQPLLRPGAPSWPGPLRPPMQQQVARRPTLSTMRFSASSRSALGSLSRCGTRRVPRTVGGPHTGKGRHGGCSAIPSFPATSDRRAVAVAVAGADQAKSHAQSWHCHCTCSYVRVHYVSESIGGARDHGILFRPLQPRALWRNSLIRSW
jgi:hypothetical protein